MTEIKVDPDKETIGRRITRSLYEAAGGHYESCVGRMIWRSNAGDPEYLVDLERRINAEWAAVEAERDTLRAALLTTRDHDEPDDPCWCHTRSWNPKGEWRPQESLPDHFLTCLLVRAALGIQPPSTSALDPSFTMESSHEETNA